MDRFCLFDHSFLFSKERDKATQAPNFEDHEFVLFEWLILSLNTYIYSYGATKNGNLVMIIGLKRRPHFWQVVHFVHINKYKIYDNTVKFIPIFSIQI